MNNKLPGWLKKDIPLLRRRAGPPSPFARKAGRVFQLLILLVLCLFAFWRVLLYRDVSRRFARIQSAGFPTSGAELNAWRGLVPDNENGALLMTRAFALLRTFPDGRSNEVIKPKILSRINEWSLATRALVEAYVHTNAPALAKARESFGLPRFRYPADFSYGSETPLPHLHQLRETAHLTALEAALDADEGRADEWAEQVELLLKLAGTLEDEPTVNSHLVYNAIIRMAAKATERNLNPSQPRGRSMQKTSSRV